MMRKFAESMKLTLTYKVYEVAALESKSTSVTVGIIVLAGFAYLVMRLYDIPVRTYFSAKRIR
jgi:hypothetical protein